MYNVYKKKLPPIYFFTFHFDSNPTHSLCFIPNIAAIEQWESLIDENV